MARIIDPDRLMLMGAVVDWSTVRRRQVQSPRAEAIAGQRNIFDWQGKITTRLVQLRWLVNPKEAGYPTEPFRVWRRPAIPMAKEREITPQVLNATGFRVITWDEPQAMIRARFDVLNINGLVYGYAGAPLTSALVGFAPLQPGTRTVKFSGPAVQSLVVSPSVNLLSLVGIKDDAANDDTWQLVETVGLPTGSSWNGVFDLDQPQGLVGNLMSPPQAALDRFRRGAPFYGWELEMAPGVTAPPWQLADPNALLTTLQDNLMDPLRQMIQTLPPRRHHTFELLQDLRLQGIGQPATTRFSPMQTLTLGAATDPLLSLMTGFGTALEDLDLPPLLDGQYFSDPLRSDVDYMVTARYEGGLSGRGRAVEYAAILFAPFIAGTPLPPTNLKASSDGLRAPNTVDQPWRGVVRLSWDKIPDNIPLRVSSYALARQQQVPAGGVVALMEPRQNDTALQPISATTSPEKEQTTGQIQALDETYPIASSASPNSLRYGVAHQDLFGVWSSWTVAGQNLQEPAVQKVTILSARLDMELPASGSICPATLVIDLSWDWSVRSLERLELVGRLYPQAKRGDNPPPGPLPGNLQKALGDAMAGLYSIIFGGSSSGTVPPGDTVNYLAEDGKTFLSGPSVLSGPRRYRIIITSFNLNFAATGHIGLALWVRGVEHRAPQRVGAWSSEPLVVSASDPRPPIIDIQHENVLLTSVADASGEHHARLIWPTVAGATGYFIYMTSEAKLRSDRNLPQPLLSQTLSERLVELRDAFGANPLACRQSFTRLNDQPITGTSTQITLPRGTKEIYLYIVMGISAGQVESDWPSLAEPLETRRRRPIAYAAPQIAAPAPPILEVRRLLDDSVTPPVYRAGVQIQTRPGAVVSQVDLHRVWVPEASLELDTMGPAVATITGSVASWMVSPTVSDAPGEAQPIGIVSGTDSPGGSWRPVFYRAVTWSVDDFTRGIYQGRSLPSAAQQLVLPPANPPDLSALSSAFSGGASSVDITWLSAAPLEPTPLGAHRLQVEAKLVDEDSSLTSLLSFPTVPGENTLLQVPSSPSAAFNTLWREPGPNGTTRYTLRLRRIDISDAIRVRVLLNDPLGRASEETLTVAPVELLPKPVILSPQVTELRSNRFQFSFQTSVPLETNQGPYIVEATLRPELQIPQGQRSLLASTGTELALNKIPIESQNDNPWSDRAAIPMRRSRPARGNTTLTLYIKSPGQLRVILRSPDGRTATHGRRLS
ncbi:hypothetical protein H6F75_13520 [Nodosilinea sp. FACHB-131]|uniref:hypothetical protein n=1 Tax=Cyanophyceae TaxID=3028117 RepID=UPI001684FFD8|nr:hypothetical protein [Nodosilinea sp. FACHB-131]MBD1874506.1 hypothetical protein [Nodosilinea sp. FACHB-131]